MLVPSTHTFSEEQQHGPSLVLISVVKVLIRFERHERVLSMQVEFKS
jgi:hypothetical protein